ncbi:hypothetical protein C1645_747547 [Glomus cerebriforme]|uniref:Uncharacterized protein n=1 Tax=Glomus cerebriforme TaxID=658196 RepID=A0A397TSE0_9GLOM|nr:hypothetical protein C1645_747547 [Glomus cerebriforme]
MNSIMLDEVVKKIKNKVKNYESYEEDFKWVTKMPNTTFTNTSFDANTTEFDDWIDMAFRNYSDSLKNLVKSVGLCTDSECCDDCCVVNNNGSVDAYFNIIGIVKKNDIYYVGVGRATFSVRNAGDYFVGNDCKVVNALRYHYYSTNWKD